MTPLERYQQDLSLGGIVPDPVQAEAMQLLQRVYDDLLFLERKSNSVLYSTMVTLKLCKKIRITGLYLWGGVGIGKTYLMDTFYHCLPLQKKMRMHFHRFMQMVHEDLTQHQGHSDPIKLVAQDIAAKTHVLCFDEFFVSDIGDAMILAGLLQALFAEGVCLVATSNVQPDQLYRNGLQRALFLPAIELIKTQTTVFHVESDRDYRLRNLEQVGVYYHPIDISTKTKMRDTFESFARGSGCIGETLSIQNRDVVTRRHASGVVWFDFAVICSVPRSQQDYLDIAKLYHTVFISHVPKITATQESAITYFINLVDVFYDCRVNLVLSAEVPMDEIYLEGRMVFEFKRTLSRLQEMQSKEYLALERKLD